MKKLLTMVLSLAMLASTIILPVTARAEAEQETYNPNIQLQNMGTAYYWQLWGTNTDTAFVQPSNKEAHSGDFSMFIRTDGLDDGNYIRLGQQYNNRDYSSTYKLSFYAKGNMDMQKVKFGFGETAETVGDVRYFTVTEAENGWKKYESVENFTVNGAFLWMLVYNQEPGTYLYVDDFSAVGTNNDNIFGGAYDSSFEKVYLKEPSGKYESDVCGWMDEWTNAENAYAELTDFASHGGSKSLFVRWAGGADGKRYKINTAMPAGVYTLSMYVKNLGSTNIDIYGEGYQNGSTFVTAEFNQEDAGNGWTRLYKTMTFTSDINYSFLVLHNTPGIYIDDITFTNEGGNVVSKVDFEETYSKYGSSSPRKPMNWTMYSPAYPSYYDGITNYAEVTDEKAYSGNYSVKIAAPSCTGYQRVLTSNLNARAGEYEVSLYARGNFDRGMMWVQAGPAGAPGEATLDFNDLKPVASDKDGWYKYAGTMNLTKGTSRLDIITIGAVNMLYIDDVSLTKAGEQNNLLVNGGFEQNKLVNKTKLANVIAYPASDGISGTISWRNPDADITSIKLYVNDTEDANFTCSTSARAINSYLLSDLAEGNEYTLRLNMVTADGTDSQTVTLKTRTGRQKPLMSREKCGAWTLLGSDSNGSYANMSADIDKSVHYSGDASLRLNSNMDGVKANVYASLSQSLTLNTQKDYKVTFKAKLDDSSIPYLLRMGQSGEYSLEKSCEFTKVSEDQNGWAAFSTVISDYDEETTDYLYPAANYSGTYSLVFENGSENVWIDDVEVYALNESGETEGENLIADGGFELAGNYTVEKTEFTNVVDGEEWELDSITSGKITASKKVECYDENMVCTYYVALYKGDILVNVQTIKKTVEAGTGYEIFSLDITVPEGDGYRIKAFMWTDDLTPISAPDPLA